MKKTMSCQDITSYLTSVSIKRPVNQTLQKNKIRPFYKRLDMIPKDTHIT